MFLNKPKFIESLFQLFDEADNELVLIVPYVKMSSDVFKALKNCDKRGVQTLMVCRKDCLKATELDKLKSLKHLTLLSHPNLHSKIYLNERNIIIGSMNLYEYSEKYNREAGILLNNYNTIFSDNEAENCRLEIKEIISGSEKLLISSRVSKYGVNFKCIELEEESLANRARLLSQYLITKSFTVKETKEGLVPTCVSFYDNIDVAISNRVAIIPNYPKNILNSIFESYEKRKFKSFTPFRVYTSSYHKMITLYAKEGEQIEDYIYTDRAYAKKVEQMVMQICEELDTDYKKLTK